MLLRRIPPQPWALTPLEQDWEEEYTYLYNAYSSSFADSPTRAQLERQVCEHPYTLSRTRRFRMIAKYTTTTPLAAPYYEDITGSAAVQASAWSTRSQRNNAPVILRDEWRYNHETGVLYDANTNTTINVFPAGTARDKKIHIAQVEYWVIFQ